MPALLIQVTATTKRTKKEKENDANGSPDKAEDIRAAKRARRRGKELIDAAVEVEHKEKKLRWTTMLFRMVHGYDNSEQLYRQRYLVQFQNQADCDGNETHGATGQTGCCAYYKHQTTCKVVQLYIVTPSNHFRRYMM